MIVRVKGSHEVFKGICQITISMAKNIFPKITSKSELDYESSEILSDISYCSTFWIHEVNVPREHFDIYPEDELDEELLNDIKEESHPDVSLLELVFMQLASEIVERYEEMRCREIDFENSSLVLIRPTIIAG